MSNIFHYIKISQPIGDMYLVKLKASIVIDITVSDTRKPYNFYNKNDNAYRGIQRKLEPERVKKIADYCVNDKNAMFPTPIILSAPSNKFIINEACQTLEFPDYCNKEDSELKYCSIVDGQHRLEGIKQSGLAEKFELIVEFVFDTDPSRDAYLFSIINANQKPISKSLIYDLYGLSKSRTVEKLCNKVMRRLNSDEYSLLRGKIKMLGYKDEFSTNGIVSQARMVDELKKLITDDSSQDNYDIEFGRELRPLDIYNKDVRYVLRQCFTANDDEQIININIEYFNVWLQTLEETKKELNNKENTFLDKSLGLSIAYRTMQLLLSFYMSEHRVGYYVGDSIINFVKNDCKIYLKLVFTHFLRNMTKEYGNEAVMNKLYMIIVKVLYFSKIVNERFLENFLSRNQYEEIIKTNNTDLHFMF